MKAIDWIITAIACAAVVIIDIQYRQIADCKTERDRAAQNVEALMTDIEHYRTKDSLSAATIGEMQLTIDEFKRYRADDAALIKTLNTKNRDLSAVMTSQSETIIELETRPRDTVIIRDSVPVKAIAVHSGDAWYDFDGLLTDTTFAGTLIVRDSLMIVETVTYKRLWGFLWKTRKIADRQIDVAGKNPHTTILDAEFIAIEK